jgi:hypothetical protein
MNWSELFGFLLIIVGLIGFFYLAKSDFSIKDEK